MRPDDGVRDDVIRWYREILCFPTWEEVLQVEYVRRHTDLNMFTDDVVLRCRELGFCEAVTWYERLQQAKAIPSHVFGIAIDHYERVHGPHDSWLTAEITQSLSNRRQVQQTQSMC